MKLKYVFAILVSIVFLVLALRQFNMEEAWLALSQADSAYILPALFLYFVSFAIRTIRWRIMLLPVKKIRHRDLFRYLVIGYTANNLLPARLGEVVRGYVTGRGENTSRTSAFASVVLERIFDGVTIVFILVVLLFAESFTWPILRIAAYTGAAVFCGGLAFLFVLAHKRDLAMTFAGFFINRLPTKAAEKINQILAKFLNGLDLLHHPRQFIASFMLSFLVWLAEGSVYYVYFIAFHVHVPWHAAALALVAVNLSGMIPSSPGMIGVFQFFFQQSLKPFGVALSTGLTISVAVHATQIVPITILGLLFLSQMGLSLFDLGKAELAVDDENHIDFDDKAP